MSYTDKLLIEARDYSIRMERLASQDLLNNMERYCAPSWTVNELAKGYDHYAATSKNTEQTYRYLRQTFTETEGKSHQLFSNVIANYIPQIEYDYTKTIFKDVKDPENQVKTAWYHLKNHGFYKTRLTVPKEKVESLKAKILKNLDETHGGVVRDMMNGKNSAPPQLKTNATWLSTCEEIFQISRDPILLSMVQGYMGVPPIFNTPVAFLNSFRPAKNAKELSDTAQLFHHDMHRLQFVKLFVYLTDVTLETGPHIMIPGTHRERPAPMWKDGRHTDEAVKAAEIYENQVKIIGKAGSVFLVDTSALHKGAHPITGSRLLAQVQYTNSLFGRPLADSDRKIEHAQHTKNKNILLAAEHVRKSAQLAGTRFMQNYI